MSNEPIAPEPTRLFDPRVRDVLIAVLLIVALSAFEGLAVAAALPQMAASLGDVGQLPWVITSYLLTAGVATVAAGSLVDRLGARPVFRVAVSVFVLGGVLAGLAQDMTTLIAARALQGLGAGAVHSVGLTAVGLVFPRKLVGRAFAANATVWGLMSVGGPALAAVLLMFASWRWIFWVNLPLGGLALAMGWNALPVRRADAEPGHPLRASDLALLGGFTFLMLYGIDALDWRTVPALAGAALALTVAVGRSRGRADAILSPRHALDTPLGPLGWGISLLLVGCIGTQTFLPVYVRGGLGGGTAITAWSVVFLVLGWSAGANLGSRALERIGPMAVTRIGAALVPFGLLGVAASAALELPVGYTFASMVPAGLGTGAATNASLTLLRGLVEDAELGRATAAQQFVRNLGFALGNGVFAAVLFGVVGATVGDVEQVRGALGHGAAAPLGGEVAAAVQVGFAWAALVAAGAAALGSAPLAAVARYVRARSAAEAAL